MIRAAVASRGGRSGAENKGAEDPFDITEGDVAASAPTNRCKSKLHGVL